MDIVWTDKAIHPMHSDASGGEGNFRLRKRDEATSGLQRLAPQLRHQGAIMISHSITINGQRFTGAEGEVLLDAAVRSGIDIAYECRAGHCGRCCVRLVSGSVCGGAGVEPGIVHSCQSRINGAATLETLQTSAVRSVEGVLASLRPLSPEVLEVGIRTDGAFPHFAGQYVQVAFNGYPSRPFSLTLPLRSDVIDSSGSSLWLHVRLMKGGCVTRHLGTRIRKGHRLSVAGPHGSAHFRFGNQGRMVCVATNTGFAPVWAIAAAALRENPQRTMMVIAGGRRLEALYMGPALAQLARFANVCVVPVCSTPQTASRLVLAGRPTQFIPTLRPTDIVYACGAPGMVDAVKAIAAGSGAICYADPFQVAARDVETDAGAVRARGLLLPRPRERLQQSQERRLPPSQRIPKSLPVTGTG